MSAKELSWDELATRLGVSRQSVVNWRAMTGAPTDRDPIKWAEFVKANNLGARGPRTENAALKEEKIKWEIEILRNRDAKDKRTVIDRDEVNQLLLHISTRARTKLYQFMETEAPPKLDGMSAAQMRPLLREMADAIAGEMADLIGQFEKQ